MRRSLGRLAIVIVASLVVALVVGIGAWGQIPGTDGTITTCYNKSGGPLNVIDTAVTKCGSNQQQLVWNQKGPAGPTGQAGASGVTNAYSAHNAHVIDTDAPDTQTLVGLSGLPSGDYIVWVTVQNAGGDDMRCDLVGSTGNLDPTGGSPNWGVPDGGLVTVMGVAKNVGNNYSVHLGCGKASAIFDDPPIGHATITALPVGSVS